MRNLFEINPGKYAQKRANQEGVGEIYKNKNATETEHTGPINFSYKYESGAVVNATETGEGEIFIFIETKNGNTDLKTYLPEGYRFVTKEYADKIETTEGDEVEEYGFGCHPGKKLIIIKNLSHPREIFTILHEIGHALIEKSEIEAFDYEVRVSGLKGPHVLNQTLSEEERGAWANALLLVRRLKLELDINILEPFGSFEEAQKFMLAKLSSYRYVGELEFEKGQTDNWFEAMFGKALRKRDRDFMKKLFDQHQLARKFGNKN